MVMAESITACCGDIISMQVAKDGEHYQPYHLLVDAVCFTADALIIGDSVTDDIERVYYFAGNYSRQYTNSGLPIDIIDAIDERTNEKVTIFCCRVKPFKAKISIAYPSKRIEQINCTLSCD